MERKVGKRKLTDAQIQNIIAALGLAATVLIAILH